MRKRLRRLAEAVWDFILFDFGGWLHDHGTLAYLISSLIGLVAGLFISARLFEFFLW